MQPSKLVLKVTGCRLSTQMKIAMCILQISLLHGVACIKRKPIEVLIIVVTDGFSVFPVQSIINTLDKLSAFSERRLSLLQRTNRH